MSLKRFCTRCNSEIDLGKEFTSVEFIAVTTNTHIADVHKVSGHGAKTTERDLCQGCGKAFRKFMQRLPRGES